VIRSDASVVSRHCSQCYERAPWLVRMLHQAIQAVDNFGSSIVLLAAMHFSVELATLICDTTKQPTATLYSISVSVVTTLSCTAIYCSSAVAFVAVHCMAQ
jgi:hypothetical protein